MFNRNSYIKHFEDILSLRDLAESTISNYLSFLNQFLDFIEKYLGGKLPEDITWEDVRLYIHHLKDDRKLNPRSINPHIAQLCDFSATFCIAIGILTRFRSCAIKNIFLMFPRSRKWNESFSQCLSQNTSVSLRLCTRRASVSMRH